LAKRFTDTAKWAKASFSDLDLKMKVVWIYLCDNCDHAGIWDINLRLMSFQIGEPVTIDEIQKGLGDKVKVLTDTKLFIPGFIDFQYGTLNPANRVHLSVIEKLQKEGAYKGLIRPKAGAKDKDKDKDKDKEILRGGVGEILETLYSGYPCKKGKSPGFKKLASDLKAGASPADMTAARDKFIAHHKTVGTAAGFVPQFKTWANSWRDWLADDAGQAEDFSAGGSLASLDLGVG
jgi:hypothetical protein